MSYYFGIPFDYAHDIHATTSMFAFERYSSKDVRNVSRLQSAE